MMLNLYGRMFRGARVNQVWMIQRVVKSFRAKMLRKYYQFEYLLELRSSVGATNG